MSIQEILSLLPNEILWIGLLALNFAGLLLFYRFFGKMGLFAWVAMSIVLANIQVLKLVELFGFVTAMGNIIYSSIFLATDILNENHSKRDAKKAVLLGFGVLIATTVVMQMVLAFSPHPDDFISSAIEEIFSFLPRIAVASIIAYTLSQLFDVWVFDKLKKRTEGKHLWLRNNVSTLCSQLIDTTIFTLIAFVGVFGLFGWVQIMPWSVIIDIFITAMIMKFIVAVLDTPIMYFARWMKKEYKIDD